MDFAEVDDMFLEDDQDILDVVDFGFPRKLYERKNHFKELDNLTFFRRFRLTKNTVLNLLQLIEAELEYNNNLCYSIYNGVASIDQLLTALRYYASAGHLATVADFIRMDISASSKIVAKVTHAIASLYPQFVKMPRQDNLVNSQTDFYHIASFPRVVTYVDGTHVKIQSPDGEGPEGFRNRKGYFAINIQAACSSELSLLDVVARPGSANGSTIFNNWRLRRRFENYEFANCILLGDSGYGLKPYLLTPLVNPLTRAERLHNEAHIRTRNVTERCFGVWKRRFPVLAYGLRLKMETILQVITATAVLHNIPKDMNEEEPILPNDINEEELNYLIAVGEADNVPEPQNEVNANHFRNQLINDYFSRL